MYIPSFAQFQDGSLKGLQHTKKNTKDVCVSGSVVCVLGPCRGKVGRRYLWEIWCRQRRLLELRRIHGLFEGEKVLIPLQSAVSSFFCCDISIDLATLWFWGPISFWIWGCVPSITNNIRQLGHRNKNAAPFFKAYLQATGGETDTTEAMYLECVAVMQPDGVSWSQIRICNRTSR